jgi:uncharacterized protein (TIGR00304 family)
MALFKILHVAVAFRFLKVVCYRTTLNVVFYFVWCAKRRCVVIDAGLFYAVGVALIVLGVLVILFAVFQHSGPTDENGQEVKGGHVEGGGVVIIGPIPIVFGSDKKTVKSLLVLSIVLTVLVLVATLVWYLLIR